MPKSEQSIDSIRELFEEDIDLTKLQDIISQLSQEFDPIQLQDLLMLVAEESDSLATYLPELLINSDGAGDSDVDDAIAPDPVILIELADPILIDDPEYTLDGQDTNNNGIPDMLETTQDPIPAIDELILVIDEPMPILIEEPPFFYEGPRIPDWIEPLIPTLPEITTPDGGYDVEVVQDVLDRLASGEELVGVLYGGNPAQVSGNGFDETPFLFIDPFSDYILPIDLSTLDINTEEPILIPIEEPPIFYEGPQIPEWIEPLIPTLPEITTPDGGYDLEVVQDVVNRLANGEEPVGVLYGGSPAKVSLYEFDGIASLDIYPFSDYIIPVDLSSLGISIEEPNGTIPPITELPEEGELIEINHPDGSRNIDAIARVLAGLEARDETQTDVLIDGVITSIAYYGDELIDIADVGAFSVTLPDGMTARIFVFDGSNPFFYTPNAPRVTIVSDVNNDGIIDASEFSDTVEVEVTTRDEYSLGDRLIVTDASGNELFNQIVSEDIIDEGVVLTLDAPMDGIPVEVNATLSTEDGMQSLVAFDSATIDPTLAIDKPAEPEIIVKPVEPEIIVKPVEFIDLPVVIEPPIEIIDPPVVIEPPIEIVDPPVVIELPIEIVDPIEPPALAPQALDKPKKNDDDTGNFRQSDTGVNVMLGSDAGDADNVDVDDVLDVSHVFGSRHDDQVIGNEGSNFVSGGQGDDAIAGEAGDDNLDGGRGSDVLDGGTGDDWLKGGKGADIITGGEGIDTADYSQSNKGVTINLRKGKATGGEATGDVITDVENLQGSAKGDRLTGNNADNWLSGGNGRDTLRGGRGNDTLEGGKGNDKLSGGLGNDWLQGDQGRDQLKGGKGDDTLVGGQGKDQLTGGAGRDTFVIDVFSTGYDTISDFNTAEDVIGLKQIQVDGVNVFGSDFTDQFVLGSAATAQNHRLIFDPSNGNLLYDADGSGADAQVRIAKVLRNGAAADLTAANFSLL